MRVIYGKDIRLVDFPADVIRSIKRVLTFDNPDYYTKSSLGKYVGNIQREIVLWQRDGSDLIVPYGMRRQIEDYARKNDVMTVDLCAESHHKVDYCSRIRPYDYQERAIQSALKAGNGVIVAPCGSGKTQIALEICARLGLRALWLTHTGELLRQSMSRAQANFEGLQRADYGTITEGKVDIGNVITFATVQTASRINISDYATAWDVVIVDECHKAVGTPTKLMMFWKVVSSLRAKYKFGITATPKRADGLTRCMYALLGGNIDVITKEDVRENTCPISVKLIFTDFNPPNQMFMGTDGILDHNKLMSAVVGDEERNELILKGIGRCKKPCLVLTDRVAHAKMLGEKAGEKTAVLVGSAGRSDRERMLEDIKSGVTDTIVATYPIAKEGLDIPMLRTVILATPTKNETTITQSCGRVGRIARGKTHGEVYDYVDANPILYRMSLSRTKIYKKLEYDVACLRQI